MSQIHVAIHGLRFEHPASFTVDRPYGLGCYLLLRFHSSVELLTAQGMVNAGPGHCILYSPSHPQWYRGQGGNLINDWMHIHVEGEAESEAVALLAARHRVPLNTLLVPGNTHFLPRLFEEITHEQQHAEEDWEDVVELLVCQLLVLLGRALRDPAAHFTPAEAAHRLALRAVRRRVHEQLAQQWTVGGMAAEVGLSASHFAALYQRFFGVSPLEDLLRARIQRAQYLLTNRAMSVSEAAAQCGFRSVHYFTHVFHQRIGCAPRDYHRRGIPSARNRAIRRPPKEV